MFTAFRIVAAVLCITVSLASSGLLLPALFGGLAGLNMATILIDQCEKTDR